MGTFGGDLLRILAHGVMNTGTTALGQYLGNMFEGQKAAKLQGMKEVFDQVRNAPDEDTRQSLLGKAYELMGSEAPKVTRTTGYMPPGLEPSAGTPDPMSQLKRSPMNLEGMTGATHKQNTDRWSNSIIGIVKVKDCNRCYARDEEPSTESSAAC